MSALPETNSTGPGGGGHICLVVDDGDSYADAAGAFLAEGRARHEKTVTIGPQGSLAQRRLQQLTELAADPHVDVLDRGALEPERMFAMFRQETATALGEGYTRLRVAADMDWLLPVTRDGDETLRFEVLLDRVVSEVGATVLCAYRRTSFSPDTILAMRCAHPVVAGLDEREPFKMVAGDDGDWILSGELDVSASRVLVPALRATASERWVVDVSGLVFADVAGMRAIATAVHQTGRTLQARGASEKLKRFWRLAGFDRTATQVVFDC